MTNRILELAMAHYDARPQECVEVPEWGPPGEPAKLYWRKANLATIAKIGAESKGNNAEYMARMICTICTDVNGKAIFNAAEHFKLTKFCDPQVIVRIFEAINSANKIDIESAEKNSEAMASD
jgi:hypothetical protein